MPTTGTDDIVKAYEYRDTLFRLFAFDDTDSLWWRGTHGATEGDLRFFVNCNDIFWWGTADVEEIILPDDLEGLAKAKADCPKEENWAWPYLWCARKRGMRPQGAFYKGNDSELNRLFNECGPRRETGIGNPSDVPE